jgi:hypothetical protein
VSILGAILILAAGLIVVFGELYASKDLERTQAWEETQGEIEMFLLARTYVADFIPSIRYRYQVAGRDYVGESIRVGGRLSFRSKRLALELENAYRVGNRVRAVTAPCCGAWCLPGWAFFCCTGRWGNSGRRKPTAGAGGFSRSGFNPDFLPGFRMMVRPGWFWVRFWTAGHRRSYGRRAGTCPGPPGAGQRRKSVEGNILCRSRIRRNVPRAARGGPAPKERGGKHTV